MSSQSLSQDSVSPAGTQETGFVYSTVYVKPGCSAWLLPTPLFKDHVSEFSSLLLSLSRMVLFPEPPNTTFRRTCALEGRDVKDYCSEWEMPWGRAMYEAKAAVIYCAWSQKGNSSRGVFCTTAEAWADSKQLPCKQKSERSLAREEV